MYRTLFILTILSILVSVSFGAVGWCGNVWPNNDAEITEGEDLSVYFQIWKDGVTDSSATAPGEGIYATLYYRVAYDSIWTPAEMVYNTDVGNNDEFVGIIPASILTSGIDIEVYCESFDATDSTTCQGNDQAGNPATSDDPLTYHIISPTAIDVTVHFSVNMNSTDTISEPVSLVGDFTSWGDSPISMTDTDSDGIYECSVLFPAGSARHQEYKYIMGTSPIIWESVPNRSFDIDDTSGGDQYIPMDYWNDATTRPVVVIFSVDMSAETVTDPYIAGSQPPLHWGWDDGWTDNDRIYDDGTHCDQTADDGIYTTAILFPRGTYRYVEYKFTTDGTDNEPLPPFQNHKFTLTDDYDTLVLSTVTFGILDTSYIEDTKLPIAMKSIKVSPNPFNTSTSIEFTISQKLSVPAKLDIYDGNGRLIKTLAGDIVAPGRYNFIWDGTNSKNIVVPSGTYMYRLENSEFQISGKVTLVK